MVHPLIASILREDRLQAGHRHTLKSLRVKGIELSYSAWTPGNFINDFIGRLTFRRFLGD